MRRRRGAHPLAIHAASPVDHKVTIASVSMHENGSVPIVIVLLLAARRVAEAPLVHQRADELNITSKERGLVL